MGKKIPSLFLKVAFCIPYEFSGCWWKQVSWQLQQIAFLQVFSSLDDSMILRLFASWREMFDIRAGSGSETVGLKKSRALFADSSSCFPMTPKKCSLLFCFSFIFTTPVLLRLERRSYFCSVRGRAEINCKPKPLSRSSRCPKLIFFIIINDIRKNESAQRADVCLPGPSNASYTAAPAAASQDPEMVLMVPTQQTAFLAFSSARDTQVSWSVSRSAGMKGKNSLGKKQKHY